MRKVWYSPLNVTEAEASGVLVVLSVPPWSWGVVAILGPLIGVADEEIGAKPEYAMTGEASSMRTESRTALRSG